MPENDVFRFFNLSWIIFVGDKGALLSRDDFDEYWSEMATVFDLRIVGFHEFKLRDECSGSLGYTLLALFRFGRFDIVEWSQPE